MSKPSLLVCRAIAPEVIARLEQHFEVLRDKRIAAAGLDVFEGEPAVHPGLLEVPNVVLTPHIGSATGPTRLAMANLAADNLINFFNGDGPTNAVNREVLHGLVA